MALFAPPTHRYRRSLKSEPLSEASDLIDNSTNSTMRVLSRGSVKIVIARADFRVNVGDESLVPCSTIMKLQRMRKSLAGIIELKLSIMNVLFGVSYIS